MMPLADQATVVRRPHYAMRGERARFMVSTRDFRAFTPDEARLFGRLESPATVGSLRGVLGAGVDAALRTLWGEELVEVIDPGTRAGRRRVLVIEPHADDAALSVGGSMWGRRDREEYVVATLASRSNFTSYFYMDREYFDPAEVSTLRARESELFAGMVWGVHRGAGLADAVLRYSDRAWTLDYFRRHRGSVSAVTSRRAAAAERERWTLAAAALIREVASEELWLPLGSPHADHQLTVNAVLGALVGSPELAAGRTVRLYQEVPYASRFPGYTGAMLEALRGAGFVLEGESWGIGAEMDAKMRLVSVYASQFKMSKMREDILACAASGGEATPSERTWVVRTMPARWPRDGVRPASAADAEAERASAAWVGRHRGASRVRVMMLLAPGTWRDDLGALRRAFPRAEIEVVAPPTAEAEVAECGGEGVVVRRVRAGASSWAMVALSAAFSRPVPQVILAGPAREALARRVAWAWPLHDTLVLRSLDPLVRACEGVA